MRLTQTLLPAKWMKLTIILLMLSSFFVCASITYAAKDLNDIEHFNISDCRCIGTFYNYHGKYQEAVKTYSRGLQLDPMEMDFYYGRAEAYRGLKQFDKAIADYSKVLSVQPFYKYAIEHRGNTYFEAKQFSNAIRDANLMISERLTKDGLLLRGKSELAIGNAVQAKKDFDRLIALDGSSFEALIGKAKSELLLGNRHEADRAFQRAESLKY